MRRPLVYAVIPLVVLAAGLAACGPAAGPTPIPPSNAATPPASSGSSSAPSITPSTQPSGTPAVSGLLLRVSQAGGFIAPSAELGALPSVSVFADGTIILPGPAQAVDPAPALPDIVVERVTATGLQAILDTAKATGLDDPNASFDGGPAPDAGVTLITIDLNGLPRHVRVSALGDATRDGNLDPKVAAARVKLRAFLTGFDDLATLAGAGQAGPSQPYQAAAMRLIVNPGDPSGGNGAPSVAWPLATPLATFGAEVAAADTTGPSGAAGLNGGGGAARCGVVRGADLATLLPIATTATVLTAWTSDGQSYGITFRPLLPDETGCPGA